jgi:hypothetical protein
MTKKHFILLAKALHKSMPSNAVSNPSPEAYRAWMSSVESVADVCAGLNPSFRRSQFIDACKGE